MLLAACFMLVSWLAYYSTLKMEAIYSSETSAHFYQTTQHYIPEERTLQQLWEPQIQQGRSCMYSLSNCISLCHKPKGKFWKFMINIPLSHGIQPSTKLHVSPQETAVLTLKYILRWLWRHQMNYFLYIFYLTFFLAIFSIIIYFLLFNCVTISFRISQMSSDCLFPVIIKSESHNLLLVMIFMIAENVCVL
jgi:hypothetical protein